VWLIVLAMNQEKTTVPIDAYPLSFVSAGQKKHYDINRPQIIYVMFVVEKILRLLLFFLFFAGM